MFGCAPGGTIPFRGDTFVDLLESGILFQSSIIYTEIPHTGMQNYYSIASYQSNAIINSGIGCMAATSISTPGSILLTHRSDRTDSMDLSSPCCSRLSKNVNSLGASGEWRTGGFICHASVRLTIDDTSTFRPVSHLLLSRTFHTSRSSAP